MIHETFSVDGTPDLEIRIESGRVELREGPPGVVDVQVDTDISEFTVEQRGNSIVVSSDRSASWLSRGSAYVVVETPPSTDIRVGVASAHVTSAVSLGRAEIKSASGDIEIGSAESLTVKTASGDLDVGTVERALRFTSASGDLRVSERASGSLAASTASGDVHIDNCDASLEMSTASGDAYVTRFEGRSADFKSMSGDVDLSIPTRTTVDLDVSTLSGKVTLPDPPTKREPPVRHTSIRAKMVSGDFKLSLA